MTPYARELIEYVMWYGKRTEQEAITFLDDNATPLWNMSSEQPKVNVEAIVYDRDEE